MKCLVALALKVCTTPSEAPANSDKQIEENEQDKHMEHPNM